MPGFSVVLCARFVSPVVRFSEFNAENREQRRREHGVLHTPGC